MSQPVKLSDSLVLDARRVLTLCRSATARPLSECLESVDTPEGRRRVQDFLAPGPFPHFEPHPDHPGMLVRIDADGKRTTGRFVNRQFISSDKVKARRR